jgi:hypothetical protein
MREKNRSAFAESTGVLLVHDPLAYIAMHPFENESKLTLAQKKKKVFGAFHWQRKESKPKA